MSVSALWTSSPTERRTTSTKRSLGWIVRDLRPRKMSIHRPSLDDVFLSLTDTQHIRNRIERGRLMSVTSALSDSWVMVTRCLRRSLRNPEAFFTALMLPIVLMLLFVYVFGGDLSTGGRYVDYVVPGPHRVVCRLRRRYDSRGSRHGHDQRHRGPDPVDAGVRVVAPRGPRRRQPGPQSASQPVWSSPLVSVSAGDQQGRHSVAGNRRDDRVVRLSRSPGWPQASASWLVAQRRRLR